MPIQAPAPAPVAEWVTPAADGGHWAVVRHRDDITSVDRYAATGALLARQFESDVSEVGGGNWSSLRLQELGDGSVVGYNRRCRLVRLNADGSLRWVSSEEPGEQPCVNLQPSASGAFWLSFRDDGGPETGLRRRDAAGRDRGRLSIDGFVPYSGALAIAGSESVYSAGDTSDVGAVVRISGQGTTEWRWQADREFASRFSRLAARAGGGVFAVGRNFVSDTMVAALDTTGQPIFVRTYLGYSGHSIRAIAPAVGGGLLTVARVPEGDSLMILVGDAAGEISRIDLPNGEACVRDDRDCALTVHANGDFALLVEREGANARLRRWSATGAPLRNVELPFAGIDLEVAAANESWLVIANQAIHRISADGQIQALPLAPTGSALSPRLLGQYNSGNERLVVLSAGSGLTVQALEPDGRLRWERTFAGDAAAFTDQEFDRDAVQIFNPYVCLRDPRGANSPPPLRCLLLTDGSTRLEQRGADELPPLWGSFGNGNVLWLDRVDGALVLRRWQLDENRELPALALPPLRSGPGETMQLHREAFRQPLMAVIGTRADTGQRIAATFGQNDEGTREHLLARFPDRAALMADYLLLFQHVQDGSGQTALELQAMNTTTGTRTSNRRLAADVDLDWKLLLSPGDAGHVLAVAGVRIDGRSVTRLNNLAFPVDELRWQRDLPYTQHQVNQLSASFLLRQGLLTADREGALELHSYDLLDGRPLSTRTLPCPGDACWSLGASPGYFSNLYSTLATIYDPRLGRRLMQLSQAIPLDTPTPPDQIGVAGPWYHDATRGQGFVLTYVPESRTLFAPWFTYAVDADRDGESAQRWYTLLGQASPGQGNVVLQIVRNRGGRFATPPVTSGEVVGSAELVFNSCDQATLSYRFHAEAENGRSGSQPWTRLGNRLLPCRRADGSVDPPSGPAADASGFSRRQSGAWFDPASSGQGFMFEVQPASGGQSGLLFAAWFTYDPQEPGDDPNAQDWVVLQGELAGASNGLITLPIVRVTGGSLGADPTTNAVGIGTAELRFDGCDRVRMDYRFDIGELAAQHNGRAGTLSLERIGGCGPE